MGRKSQNWDLEPGQIHSNESRDTESWTQILTGRGNLGRKCLFSKNNNRGASILWRTLRVPAQERGRRTGLWPRAAWEDLKCMLSDLCSLPRWPVLIVVSIYVYFSPILFKIFDWRRVALPYGVTFCCAAKWTSCRYTSHFYTYEWAPRHPSPPRAPLTSTYSSRATSRELMKTRWRSPFLC